MSQTPALCGICRVTIPKGEIPVDTEFQEKVKADFPEEFSQHQKELEKELKIKQAQVEISFKVGNTHREVPNPKMSRNGEHKNKHSWTAYVEFVDKPALTSKFIDKVTFELHPTFKDPIRVVKAKPS